ncbi:MAG: glycosyltransferase family 2 protein [Actinobacteria bacterium]|nr:glycosyltransferase family 2 protein [Actinomycetota bacterium]
MTELALRADVQAAEITCVIVAYHSGDRLAPMVARFVGAGLHVVVVNVEADPEVRTVAERNGARVLDLPGNPGYATAVNYGVEEATTEFVVFMNDDARIEADAVQRLAAVVAGGKADVAVPRVLDAAGELERTIAAVPSVGTLAREWLLLPDAPVAALDGRIPVEKWRAPDAPERIEAASAVVVAAARALVAEVPLPEDYFLYWEESEWFWALRARGAVVEYRPDVECVHAGGRDVVRRQKSRLLARNAVRCVRRTQGKRAAVAAWFVVIAWNARLVAADLLRAALRPTPARWARLDARWAGLTTAVWSWREIR